MISAQGGGQSRRSGDHEERAPTLLKGLLRKNQRVGLKPEVEAGVYTGGQEVSERSKKRRRSTGIASAAIRRQDG